MIKKDGGTQTDHYKGDAFDRQLFFSSKSCYFFTPRKVIKIPDRTFQHRWCGPLVSPS